MPFVCVLQKFAGESGPERARFDASRLGALLCPYDGDLRRLDLRRGELFVSRLAATGTAGEAPICLLPKGTGKGPQTAWLEVTDDGDGLRFETDPLGTFPLWVFENDRLVVVTGEVKALLAFEGVRVDFRPHDTKASDKRPKDFSPYRNVRRVTPGAVLRVTDRCAIVEEARSPLAYRPASRFASKEEAAAALDAALLASARSMGAFDSGTAAFLSGGIDSSTATSLATRLHEGVRTFTLGTEFGDEYADAEELATWLGTPHARVFARGADAIPHFERATFCNETIDGLTAETLAQLAFLEAAASPSARHAVTGYGADLLFGSMLRHALYLQVTGVDDLQSLIERTCWSGEFAPFHAWSLGMQVHHLFWDPALMNCAFRVPAEMSFDGVREKVVLRELAVVGGYMQERHAFRTKTAMTDGTQFNRVLSSALKLPNKHSYDEKNAACIDVLSKLFTG